MALLFADGFEHYGTGTTIGPNNMLQGEYAQSGTASQVIQGSARTGQRYYMDSQAGGLRKQYATTHNEVGVAVAMYLPEMPSTDNARVGFAIMDENNNLIVSVGVMPNGSVRVDRTGAIVVGQTDAAVISTAAWNHFEFRILQDNVVGEVELRVNGVVELVVDNLNLGAVLPRFWRTWAAGTTGGIQRRYDDLILWDTTGDINNTFFGPARVTPVQLAGDETGNQWSVVGAGTGADALTEAAPNGDTTYISAAAVGAISDFSIDELPPEAEAIAGVYIVGMGKLASAGIGSARISVVSDSAVQLGRDDILTAAYTYRGNVFEKDPATGQLWTKTALEAALVRVEKTA